MCVAEAECYRVRQALRYFPKETARLKAENTAPNAAQTGRHDGCVHAFHDPLELTSKWQQNANARNVLLGKHSNDLSLPNGISGCVQRPKQFARLRPGRDGDHVQPAEQ